MNEASQNLTKRILSYLVYLHRLHEKLYKSHYNEWLVSLSQETSQYYHYIRVYITQNRMY